ncbi:PaaI family thioesterase [Limibacillus halophilus]
MTQHRESPSEEQEGQEARSGFSRLTSYRLLAWREDEAEVGVTVEEQHINRSGVLHGGMLATLLDAACGYAGTYSADPEKPRRAFTLSLNCQFIQAAKLGERLVARGVRSGGGKGVFFARAELRNEAGDLIGQGEGVFKYIAPR